MGFQHAVVGAATISFIMGSAALAGTMVSTVVAQIPPPASDWAGLVGQMGIGGILVWYLYYTTSVLLPRIHDQHQKAITVIVDQFREDLRLEREQSKAMHGDLRELLMRLGSRPCLLENEDTDSE
jgi:hypothetical protein